MQLFRDYPKKKIVLLLGHPDASPTLCSELALLYETAAKKAGHEVRRFNLAEMHFDPILHQGYKARQELEPDLLALQEAVRWSEHVVIIYPTWWCSMPALLKGLFDRAWLPGFAFAMYKTGWRAKLSMSAPLLSGKTARVITTSAGQPLLLALFQANHTAVIRNSILQLAGIKTRVLRIGPALLAPEWRRQEWRKHVAYLGRLGE